MRRALRLAPEKAKPQAFLDFAKGEFFSNHATEAVALLREAALRFPDEWKLHLERVQQLVGVARVFERRCCRGNWRRPCG